jgi:two-component system, LuxR family, sensor histidine kinase DctS
MLNPLKIDRWPTRKWRWVIAILLALLFLISISWLPWQVQRMEGRERQAQLVADTLLVQQAIEFQLNRNEEIVRQVGEDIMQQRLSRPAAIERFQQLIKINDEIHRIDWLDEHGRAISSTAASALYPTEEPVMLLGELRGFQVDGKTRCAPPSVELGTKDTYLLSCTVPLIKAQQREGSIVLSYRLQSILEEMVPWWFAQNNQISLLSADGKVLAVRASGGVGQHVYIHQSALELPSMELNFRADSTRDTPGLLSNLLVLGVVALALALAWSLLALWRDISRRLAAESALRQQVAFRVAMGNSLTTGIRARDMQGRLTFVNPAFCKMVGLAAEEIIGRMPPMPYWVPDGLEEYQARFARMLSGAGLSNGLETVYQRANGERFPVLIYESPLLNEHGVQTGWMSSISDISELKAVQEQMRQQQERLDASARLATIGEIGSTLAHELNQPLAAISSYSTGAINMLKNGHADAALLQGAMQKVSDQAQRAGQVIHSVQEFVKKREVSRQLLDLPELITGILPLVELQAKASHTHLQCQLDAALPKVMADKVLLEQVLLNLTRNAIEAMTDCLPERRILRIVVRGVDDANSVAVEVIDQGPGISDAVANQLFEPFFSTKSNGMGMGLNICRTAIEFHGGSLKHEANPSGGTIFKFSLPATLAKQHFDATI